MKERKLWRKHWSFPPERAPPWLSVESSLLNSLCVYIFHHVKGTIWYTSELIREWLQFRHLLNQAIPNPQDTDLTRSDPRKLQYFTWHYRIDYVIRQDGLKHGRQTWISHSAMRSGVPWCETLKHPLDKLGPNYCNSKRLYWTTAKWYGVGLRGNQHIH